MTPGDHVSEALRARVLAVAGGAAVRFEQVECRGEPGRIIHFRVWVGPPGGARLFGGRTLEQAAGRAIDALCIESLKS